jgi:hypothetical protein
MTKWCLLCGGEYVAGALECADCLVPLSDRRPLSLDELGTEDEEQVAYDFDELEPMQRLHIDELFWSNGIAHAWDDKSLIVRDEDEERADALIDEADRDAFLESDSEQISYELDDWTDEQRAELAAALAQASIEHAWDENGELVVLEHDEARVDTFVDAIEAGQGTAAIDAGDEGDLDAGTVDGVDAQDVLSELFVASDRLMHDPLDHEGVLALVDAARLAKALPLPYGFAPAVWDDLLLQVDALAELLNRDDVDDDAVIEAATNLRSVLRQWV